MAAPLVSVGRTIEQIGIDEFKVSVLVFSIVVHVLGHVGVQHRQCRRVGGVAGPAGNLAILDPAQLVVLLSGSGLQDFCRRQKPQNCRISGG